MRFPDLADALQGFEIIFRFVVVFLQLLALFSHLLETSLDLAVLEEFLSVVGQRLLLRIHGGNADRRRRHVRLFPVKWINRHKSLVKRISFGNYPSKFNTMLRAREREREEIGTEYENTM